MRAHAPFSWALRIALVVALLVLAQALLLQQVEPLIEAAWLGLEEPSPFDSLAIRWASWFAISLFSYVLMTVAARGFARVLSVRSSALLRSYLGFQAIIAWIFMLQHYTLAVAAQGEGPQLPANQTQVLLVASLSALLWPAVSGTALDLRTASSIFLTSAIGLEICAVVLDHWMLQGWAVSLGLSTPPKSMLLSRDFLAFLPFILGAPPMLWELARSWRRTRPQASAHDAAIGELQR